MKIRKTKRKAKGRTYMEYRAYLTAEEGQKLMSVSPRWVINDIDPKGYAELKAPSKAFATATGERPVKSSVRFHGSREEWAEFKRLCRSRGTTMCHVISDFVQAALERKEHLLEAGTVQIINVWTTAPRAHGEELAGKGIGVV